MSVGLRLPNYDVPPPLAGENWKIPSPEQQDFNDLCNTSHHVNFGEAMEIPPSSEQDPTTFLTIDITQEMVDRGEKVTLALFQGGAIDTFQYCDDDYIPFGANEGGSNTKIEFQPPKSGQMLVGISRSDGNTTVGLYHTDDKKYIDPEAGVVGLPKKIFSGDSLSPNVEIIYGEGGMCTIFTDGSSLLGTDSVHFEIFDSTIQKTIPIEILLSEGENLQYSFYTLCKTGIKVTTILKQIENNRLVFLPIVTNYIVEPETTPTPTRSPTPTPTPRPTPIYEESTSNVVQVVLVAANTEQESLAPDMTFIQKMWYLVARKYFGLSPAEIVVFAGMDNDYDEDGFEDVDITIPKKDELLGQVEKSVSNLDDPEKALLFALSSHGVNEGFWLNHLRYSPEYFVKWQEFIEAIARAGNLSSGKIVIVAGECDSGALVEKLAEYIKQNGQIGNLQFYIVTASRSSQWAYTYQIGDEYITFDSLVAIYLSQGMDPYDAIAKANDVMEQGWNGNTQNGQLLIPSLVGPGDITEPLSIPGIQDSIRLALRNAMVPDDGFVPDPTTRATNVNNAVTSGTFKPVDRNSRRDQLKSDRSRSQQPR